MDVQQLNSESVSRFDRSYSKKSIVLYDQSVCAKNTFLYDIEPFLLGEKGYFLDALAYRGEMLFSL